MRRPQRLRRRLLAGMASYCLRDVEYDASCEVMHGLVDLTIQEKIALEKKCSLTWPCAGVQKDSKHLRAKHL